MVRKALHSKALFTERQFHKCHLLIGNLAETSRAPRVSQEAAYFPTWEQRLVELHVKRDGTAPRLAK